MQHGFYPLTPANYNKPSIITDLSKEMQDLLKARIIDLTVEEFISILEDHLEQKLQVQLECPPPPYVYGLGGLAHLLGCSDTTAWRIKKSGILDSAYHQYGKTIVFESKKVLELMGKK